jgi:hypothetical protein
MFLYIALTLPFINTVVTLQLFEKILCLSFPPRNKYGINSGGNPDVVTPKAGSQREIDKTGFLSTQETLDSCWSLSR